MIPRVHHRIWLGPKPLPDQEAVWLDSVFRHHPGWEVKLWLDSDVAQLNLCYRDRFQRASTFAEKADLLRYELLFQFGGVYTDTDIEFLKPIDDLLEGKEAFSVRESRGNVGMSVLGSEPYSPFFADVMRLLPCYQGKKSIPERTGPRFMDAVYGMRSTSCHLFPASYFFPYPWQHAGKYPYSMDFARKFPGAFAVHHWRMSWK